MTAFLKIFAPRICHRSGSNTGPWSTMPVARYTCLGTRQFVSLNVELAQSWRSAGGTAIAFFVTVVSLVVSIYTLWQAGPQRMERLGINAAVGMRSSATMKSDAAWNAGYGAAWLKVKQGSVSLFIASLVSSVVLPFTSTDSKAVFWGAIVCASYLAYLWLLLVGFKCAKRAAQDLTSKRPRQLKLLNTAKRS